MIFAHTDTYLENSLTQAEQIFALIWDLGNFEPTNFSWLDIPLFHQLQKSIQKQEKLLMILPAFPAKSSNREKTLSDLPDLGEFFALAKLEKLCLKIESIYKPGAEMIICSDGRVFNDLVMVTDENVQTYKIKIENIIEKNNFHHLSLFSLEDCFGSIPFTQMRENLVALHSTDLLSLKNEILSTQTGQQLFNGIHRFMIEDLKFHFQDISKNQLNNLAKEKTYQVIQRSCAWDSLLEKYFANTLRFSIHPYPVTHRKFGIRFLESNSRWATPWHNVVVKNQNGWCLMKRKDAESLGGRVQYFQNEYAYYEC